jgi:hypothetical protein
MNIDWVNCVLGGILIGCATAVYLIVNGQALRISDMLGELILGKISNNWNNQILFLIGLLITPIIYAHYVSPIDPLYIPSNPYILCVSGLFIGIGAQMIKGFTFGRVVCGLSNYSRNNFLIIILVIAFGFVGRQLSSILGLV